MAESQAARHMGPDGIRHMSRMQPRGIRDASSSAAAPFPTPIGDVLHLQRAIGNQAVIRLLQPRLGTPGMLRQQPAIASHSTVGAALIPLVARRASHAASRSVAPPDAAVQREVTGGTLKTWQQVKPSRLERGKRRDYNRVRTAIHDVLWNPGEQNYLRALEDIVRQLLANRKRASFHNTLQHILDDIESDRPLPRSEITAYVQKHEEELFPEAGGDFADEELRKLLSNILINKLDEMRVNGTDLAGRAKGLAKRGIDLETKQFHARALCQEAVQALRGNFVEVKPRGRSKINWNHYIIPKGTGWIDPTWKQFFKREDTVGKPPIFRGTADDFRALGLPGDDTLEYLRLVGKAPAEDAE